jgi:predicted O-methyltransferase YrrM
MLSASSAGVKQTCSAFFSRSGASRDNRCIRTRTVSLAAAMHDDKIMHPPAVLDAIRRDTDRIGFTVASELQTGSLLRALTASKHGGLFLELGTGTGVGTAWMVAGMDDSSRLTSVDNDPEAQEIARRHLGLDRRITFRLEDGASFLDQAKHQFDLIYADTWPGKFAHLERALSLVKVGGIYFVDDLLPQVSWPAGHAEKVQALLAELENRSGFVVTKLAWASGLMMLVRTSAE